MKDREMRGELLSGFIFIVSGRHQMIVTLNEKVSSSIGRF